MNLALHFARRYLFSRKSVNAINIISGISVVGVFFSTAALIIILSFFNGMEKLILSMYSSFTSELRIEPTSGKTFDASVELFQQLATDPRVAAYSEVLQEKVLLRHHDQQFIATLKGVSPHYANTKSIDTMMYDGHFILAYENDDYAVMGAYIQHALGISLYDESAFLEVFTPRKGVVNAVNPADEFNMRQIKPAGVMFYHQEFDDVVFVPVDFARELLGEFEEVSAIELDLNSKTRGSSFQKELAHQLGPDYVVMNREQQNPSLYKTIRSEKWAVFFILTLTGIIAIFNIIGSLTMLVIDKKDDIGVLRSMGANDRLIRRIFFYQGVMIALIGCIAGLVVGLLFCFSQLQYGWLSISQAGNLVSDTYPVDIRWMDVLLVFTTISIVATLISYLSSRLSIKP